MSRPPALPAFVAPMLARSGTPFDSEEHLFEIKWDGTRTLAFIESGQYRLVNRRRIDMTDRYPEFAFLADLPSGTILDAETVVLRDGKPDFNLLQRREQAQSPLRIRTASRSTPATLIVFDLLYASFKPVTARPLTERRAALDAMIQQHPHPQLVVSDGIVGAGKAFFEQACLQGLEGVMAKRLDSPYLPGKRSAAWQKIKRGEVVPCVIIGFVPKGKDGFKNLILAAHEDGKLRCVGKVGTGFDTALRQRLEHLLYARPRSKPLVPCREKGARWVEPGLYCTVRCMERTAGGELRAPAFGELTVEGAS